MPVTLNALVLMGVVYGLVELLESAWPGLAALPASRQRPITIGLVTMVSVASTFLVRASVWAHEQILGGHALDKLNVPSTLVACVFVAGGAVSVDRILKTVANIGQNVVHKPVAQSVISSAEKVPSSPVAPIAQ